MLICDDDRFTACDLFIALFIITTAPVNIARKMDIRVMPTISSISVVPRRCSSADRSGPVVSSPVAAQCLTSRCLSLTASPCSMQPMPARPRRVGGGDGERVRGASGQAGDRA